MNYFYDKEADVFYFTQGTPSARDEVVEAGDDVLLRINSRSKKVSGFTLLNATKRQTKTQKVTSLPFTFTQMAA